MQTTQNTTMTTDTLRENTPKPGGGYRRLLSFQLATIIYDATVSFCNRFVDRSSRTHDRMVQAARNGRQHIAASGRAGAAGSTTAIDLRNEARSSLDELLLDFEDFLRQRKLQQWAKDGSEAQALRTVALEHKSSEELDPLAYTAWLEHTDPAVAANALMCLIHLTDNLLIRQAAAQECRCIRHDGSNEQPPSNRCTKKQGLKHPTDSSDTQAPVCGLCGKPMALRTARKGKNEGRSFWGCTGYPECKGTMPGENPA